MCGRARCTLGADDVGAACGLQRPLQSIDLDRYHPSYNATPGAWLPIVRYDDAEDGERRQPLLQPMKWGLIPSYTKKSEKLDHFRMFNARSETVQHKSCFSRLLHKKRCVLCIEGFYEWKKDHGQKQPYYVHFKEEGRPLVLACLYDSWRSGEGESLFTFTILTTQVSKQLEWLHDRMPVILGSQEAIAAWLGDSNLSTEALQNLLRPYEASDLVWYSVTPAMGKPSFNGPECIKELKPSKNSQQSIASFFKRKATEKREDEKQTKKPKAENGADAEL